MVIKFILILLLDKTIKGSFVFYQLSGKNRKKSLKISIFFYLKISNLWILANSFFEVLSKFCSNNAYSGFALYDNGFPIF